MLGLMQQSAWVMVIIGADFNSKAHPAAFGGVGDSRRFNGGDASVGAGGNILLLRSALTNWGELPANVPIVWG